MLVVSWRRSTCPKRYTLYQSFIYYTCKCPVNTDIEDRVLSQWSTLIQLKTILQEGQGGGLWIPPHLFPNPLVSISPLAFHHQPHRVQSLHMSIGLWVNSTLLKIDCYSSTTMCQNWDNHLIYWAVYWLFYWHVPIVTHCNDPFLAVKSWFKKSREEGNVFCSPFPGPLYQCPPPTLSTTSIEKPKLILGVVRLWRSNIRAFPGSVLLVNQGMILN